MGSANRKRSNKKRSNKKRTNSYSPNDPRMISLMKSASRNQRVAPLRHLFDGLSNPSINMNKSMNKGGNKTRKNNKCSKCKNVKCKCCGVKCKCCGVKGGYVSIPLRKTYKNKSRKNNSRVGGYVYGGNLGLNHFYPHNTNVMSYPVVGGGKGTRSHRKIKGGSVLLGAPFTQGNLSSFGNTPGLSQSSEILFGNE
jgi:hypothetical protein